LTGTSALVLHTPLAPLSFHSTVSLSPGTSNDSTLPPFHFLNHPYLVAPSFSDTDGLTVFCALSLCDTERTGSFSSLSYDNDTSVSSTDNFVLPLNFLS
jgi:hypothetical protein